MDGNVPSIFPDLYLHVRRSANTGNGRYAGVDDISAIERLTPAYWGAMIVIPACVVLTASNAVGAEKFQRLTGSQIRAKFAGMEVTDEVRWRDIYERDGTLRSDSISRKRLGKWLIHGRRHEKKTVPAKS